jgi:hypothetical protein
VIGFEQVLRMAKSDSLDRARSDLKAEVLPQLYPSLSERFEHIESQHSESASCRPHRSPRSAFS